MSGTLLQVDRVSKRYCRDLKRSLWYGVRDLANEFTGQPANARELRPGEFWAVDNVSFQLGRGECLGLIGPNGAGKSTLLKVLNGLIKPDGGRVNIRGRTGALIELGAGFHPVLSGRENIFVNGSILGMTKREINRKYDQIIDFAEIGDAIDAPVRTYSSGMRVRLGFAIAAVLGPNVLLIDEVLAVGDIGFRMKCFKHILSLKQAGTTILLVSHNMVDINRVCDRVVVMQGGQKCFEGRVGEGISRYENMLVREAKTTKARTRNGVSIQDLELRDGEGNRSEDYQTGDTLCGVVSLRSNRQIVNARINAHIESPSLGKLAGFATPYSDFRFDLEPGMTQVSFRLPNLPLLMGGYTISLYLYGPGMEQALDVATAITQFRIVGPRPGNFNDGVSGAIALEHSWNFVAHNGDLANENEPRFCRDEIQR